MSGLAAAAAAAALGAAGAVALAARARRDLAAAQAALGGAEVTPGPFGPVAWRAAGEGPAALLLHGAGGGYDQGMLLGGPIAARGMRVIAPSRLGYPGSAAPPPGAGPEEEAAQQAALLAALGVGRAAVAGLSAGCLPALALALARPDLVRALLLIVPVLRLPGAPPVLRWGRAERALAEALLRADALAWAAIRGAPRWVLGRLMATDPALLRGAEPEEQARVRAMMAGLLPVRPRAAGFLMDAAAVARPCGLPLGRIAAPVLLIALEDDRFGSAAIARGLAARLPAAELALWPRGGHLAVGVYGEILARALAFLDRHA